MKRVSFEVAKALKEAGYPQGNTDKCYLIVDHNQFYKKGQIVDNTEGEWTVLTKNLVDIPTYFDAWLWLWREKGIRIREEITKVVIYNNSEIGYITKLLSIYNDPEEAIIAAIKFLVENNLIK